MTTTSSTSSATSSSTTGTTSVGASILAALGTGSGIDWNTLSTQLAAADYAVKTDSLNSQASKLTTQISDLGTLKSSLTLLDSALSSRISEGDLSPQPNIANSSVASGKLSGTVTPKGSYSLTVNQLAAAETLASPAYASQTATVGSGTLTLKFGTVADGGFTQDSSKSPVDITIAAGSTLADVANAINQAGAGVTAYVTNTTSGSQLVLKGTDGAANGFVLDATEASGDPGLANLAWEPTGTAADSTRLLASASDASFTIDGLNYSSASNTVNDAVPGVNLTLTGTNAGNPTQISFADTTSSISSTMSDLVSALNTIVNQLNPMVDPKTGDLAGDSGARGLRTALAQLPSTTVMPNATNGEPQTLADLGLKLQADGTFTLDSTQLNHALTNNPDAVAAMFTNGLYGVYGTIDKLVNNAVASTDTNSIAYSIKTDTATQSDVATQLASVASLQAQEAERLLNQFSATEGQINDFKSTQSYLTNQIAAWNKSS